MCARTRVFGVCEGRFFATPLQRLCSNSGVLLTHIYLLGMKWPGYGMDIECTLGSYTNLGKSVGDSKENR